MSFDEKLLRSALGRFATGVCVVAWRNSNGFPLAMTINSFSSLSLTPALVQWSIKKESVCRELFSDSEQFSVSVLSQGQQDVSQRYAKPGEHLMHNDDCAISDEGLPYIQDCIAYFECRPWQIFEAGDHDLIVAAVDRFVDFIPEEPLVFYKGRYRALMEA